MANGQHLVIIHRIPGRLRLGGDPLRGDPARASRVALAVRRINGVTGARENPSAASLVIEYDASLPLGELLRRLEASAELSAWGFGRIEREQKGGASGGAPPAAQGSPARTAETLLHAVARINSASSAVAPPHLDLKLILPGALFGYGLFRLVTGRHGPTPHWLVFFMYGFDAFAQLNQGIIRRFLESAPSAPAGGGIPS
jgi:hypothetical protein